MENRIRLSIPQPCSAKWESFTPNNDGGFCGSCQKTVIDFTKMTDAEVMQFLKTKPTHACGRFRTDQLKEYREIPMYSIRPSRMLLRAGMISLFLALISKPTFSQTVTEPAKKEMTTNARPTSAPHVVKGTVFDENNQPFPGANIVLKGAIAGTVTDEKGRFEFPIALKEGDQLTVSFIGYQTSVYTVGSTLEPMDMMLTPDVTVLGGIGLTPVMMGAVAISEPEPPKPHRSWVATIKSWF